jgi:tetraacyldisaccharide 4'-kinase
MTTPSSPRKLLLPLVPAYRLALLLRELSLRAGIEPVNRLRFPVVSIGNLSAGGAGKTPLTIALAKALEKRGLRVDVLSRGYGRARSNPAQRPARVDPDGAAEDFGDEPLLIARETGVPVYVAGQRFGAGQLAEAEAPPGVSSQHLPAVHILDDGFQHRQLYRDVDILLLNRRDWLEEGLLPAGNLREPRKAARRATIIAIPAPDNAPELEAALREWGWEGPVWRLHRKMDVPPLQEHEAGPVAAFCGIARPEQFFAGLEAAGQRIAARVGFPDHYRFSPADVNRLVATAKQTGATALITTDKDFVRLGKLASAFPESLPLKTAHLRIEIEHESEAIDCLLDLLDRATV